ncbi:hypothetical protein CEXT_70971 [Caerostris extrusa]|uniref:Uncharacterized protein n=1 Tax=Caerostris extrusa TaxID=172846 RepID=A0AAV4TRQ2_CAEEX|nr:hypothetical protein CEXT_70971 [Caerostris extrusa]
MISVIPLEKQTREFNRRVFKDFGKVFLEVPPHFNYCLMCCSCCLRLKTAKKKGIRSLSYLIKGWRSNSLLQRKKNDLGYPSGKANKRIQQKGLQRFWKSLFRSATTLQLLPDVRTCCLRLKTAKEKRRSAHLAT